MFQAEVKREFSTQCLKNLRIQWGASGFRRHLPVPACYTILAATMDLQSVDDIRATFGLRLRYRINHVSDTPPDANLDPKLEALGMYGHLHRHLSNSDRNTGARLGPDPELVQLCELGSYIIDAPLTIVDLDLDGGTQISFEWEKILDSLLGVYAHSQNQARKERCSDLDADTIETCLLQTFGGEKTVPKYERNQWVQSYGSAEARNCFQDAYAERVKRFHKMKGLFFEPNLDRTDYHLDDSAWRKFGVYIDSVIEKRSRYIFDNFMAKHGMAYE